MIEDEYTKNTLLFSGSSRYRHRPYVNQCVKDSMGDEMTVTMANPITEADGRLTQDEFFRYCLQLA